MKFPLTASVAACLSFLLFGCGPTEEEKAAQMVVDVNNMCAEISATTVGFSGPSKRLEIMGKYGIEPSVAQGLNLMMETAYDADAKKASSDSENWQSKMQCMVDLGDCQGNALVIKPIHL